MSDKFPIITPVIQVDGNGVRPDSVQAGFRSLSSQISAALNPVSNFSPASIPGMKLWLDAQLPSYTNSYATRATNLGDQVFWFPDQSGTWASLQAGATKPTYNPAGINGRPAWNMGGNSMILSDVTMLSSAYDTALTVFVVEDTTNSVANNVLVSAAPAGAMYLSKNAAQSKYGYNAVNLSVSGPAGAYVNGNGNNTNSGVHVFSYDGANSRRGFDDTYLQTSGTPYNSSAAASKTACTGNLGMSGQLTIGAYTGGSNFTNGHIGEVVVYNAALTSAQIQQVMDYLNSKWGFRPRNFLMCDGNSLSSGTGSTSGATQNLATTGDNYPCQLWNLLGSLNWQVRLDAFPGRTTQSLLSGAPDFTDMFVSRSASPKNIALVWEITNTLANFQGGAAYQLIVQYCLARRAAGYKVIVGTCLLRQDSPYAGFPLDMAYVNGLIRTNWPTFADGIADFQADPRLQDPTNTTYFFTDKVHLNSVGYGVVANIAQAAILKI